MHACWKPCGKERSKAPQIWRHNLDRLGPDELTLEAAWPTHIEDTTAPHTRGVSKETELTWRKARNQDCNLVEGNGCPKLKPRIAPEQLPATMLPAKMNFRRSSVFTLLLRHGGNAEATRQKGTGDPEDPTASHCSAHSKINRTPLSNMPTCDTSAKPQQLPSVNSTGAKGVPAKQG
jgi:hypothetical protein